MSEKFGRAFSEPHLVGGSAIVPRKPVQKITCVVVAGHILLTKREMKIQRVTLPRQEFTAEIEATSETTPDEFAAIAKQFVASQKWVRKGKVSVSIRLKSGYTEGGVYKLHSESQWKLLCHESMEV